MGVTIAIVDHESIYGNARVFSDPTTEVTTDFDMSYSTLRRLNEVLGYMFHITDLAVDDEIYTVELGTVDHAIKQLNEVPEDIQWVIDLLRPLVQFAMQHDLDLYVS